MERPAAVVFGSRIDSTATEIIPMPSAYVETAFTYQLFRGSPEDEFQLRQLAHAGLVDIGRLRTTIYYGSFLFLGPISDGARPGAAAAPWLMNGIQFEYGLTAQYPVGDWVLVGEYGRRSYHPLRGGFADPAADIFRGGVAPPVLRWRSLALETLFRASWNGLLDAWGPQGVDDARSPYTFHQAWDLRLTPPSVGPVAPAMFVTVLGDLSLRESGALYPDVELNAGVSLAAVTAGRGRGVLDLYLDAYSSRDTEQRPDRETPATLLGYGLRFRFEP